jgi:hypothetical protein
VDRYSEAGICSKARGIERVAARLLPGELTLPAAQLRPQSPVGSCDPVGGWRTSPALPCSHRDPDSDKDLVPRKGSCAVSFMVSDHDMALFPGLHHSSRPKSTSSESRATIPDQSFGTITAHFLRRSISGSNSSEA